MISVSDQEESCKVISELEAELELLSSTLEEKGGELHDIIKEEKQRKEVELQVMKYLVFPSILCFVHFLLKWAYIIFSLLFLVVFVFLEFLFIFLSTLNNEKYMYICLKFGSYLTSFSCAALFSCNNIFLIYRWFFRSSCRKENLLCSLVKNCLNLQIRHWKSTMRKSSWRYVRTRTNWLHETTLDRVMNVHLTESVKYFFFPSDILQQYQHMFMFEPP